MTKIIFMSGLPRSGSTLLMNIMAQNPKIQPSGTSGLFEVIQGMRNQYTVSNNVKSHDEVEMDTRFKSACKAAIDGWAQGEGDMYIDKSRAWPQHFEFLENIGLKPYLIVTIRDLRAVLSSMEKLYRNNSLRIDPVAGNTTTKNRVQVWGGGVPVGESANQIEDLFTRGLQDRICFVKYEELVIKPFKVLSEIYEYIEEPEYQHEFNEILQVTQEDDRLHGIPDLHVIRPELKAFPVDWEEVLGKDLSDGITQGATWFYERFYRED